MQKKKTLPPLPRPATFGMATLGAGLASAPVGANVPEEVLVKYMALGSILLNPRNHRKLHLTTTMMEGIVRRFPFKDVVEGEMTPEEYVAQVSSVMQLPENSQKGLLRIAVAALSIPSADKLIHPITAYKSESGFTLLAGECRLLAHYLIGETRIKTIVHPRPENHLEELLMMGRENTGITPITFYERLLFAKDVVNERKLAGETVSARSMVKVFGMKKTRAAELLQILNSESFDKILAEAEAGRIENMTKALSLCGMREDQIDTYVESTKQLEQTQAVASATQPIPLTQNTDATGAIPPAGADSTQTAATAESTDVAPKIAGIDNQPTPVTAAAPVAQKAEAVADSAQPLQNAASRPTPAPQTSPEPEPESQVMPVPRLSIADLGGKDRQPIIAMIAMMAEKISEGHKEYVRIAPKKSKSDLEILLNHTLAQYAETLK